ncbi:MAG: HesA/MoeB/ThiF family protein [Dehalococcoidales bacterium]|nr:HesA/MoeB/ThiF family protein [Dehalococcoidales bacterium]
MLTKKELIRYSRQIAYPGLEEDGQQRLKASHVVVAGLGGLGCLAATYLACAGVGRITVVDCDSVELSNLNRQMLHWEDDVGEPKPQSVAEKLKKINSTVKVVPVFEKITENNARGIIKKAQVVIDATDNFETRFILNAACVAEKIPLVHGGVHSFLGELTTIIPGETPCLACVFPDTAKKQNHFPVFGVNPALVATLQVTETIKLIAGFGTLLKGRMLYINAETMEFKFFNLSKRVNCPVCGQVNAKA